MTSLDELLRALSRIDSVCKNIKLATDPIPKLTEHLEQTAAISNQLEVNLPNADKIRATVQPTDDLLKMLDKETTNFENFMPLNLQEGLEILGQSETLSNPMQEVMKRLDIAVQNYETIGTRELSDVGEVVELTDPDQVNEKLDDGWVLLAVNADAHPTKFVLGKDG